MVLIAALSELYDEDSYYNNEDLNFDKMAIVIKHQFCFRWITAIQKREDNL